MFSSFFQLLFSECTTVFNTYIEMNYHWNQNIMENKDEITLYDILMDAS